MAVLTQPAGVSRCFFDEPASTLPPAGTFRAKIIDIADKFGVERTKYQSEEIEKVDLTQFRFGFRDKQGKAHTIDSRQMKISGHENSALFSFLKSILGTAPKMGWDYMEVNGREVLITIEHEEGNVATYARIVTISPLPYADEPPAQDLQEPKAAAQAKGKKIALPF